MALLDLYGNPFSVPGIVDDGHWTVPEMEIMRNIIGAYQGTDPNNRAAM